ncbi:MAG: GNAT family N-acetyltransferase [Bacillota bacterium]|nr:GNAT family N-acetyltransferase [Bacillota bacterium]
MKELKYQSVGPDEISKIKGLWEGLREHHMEKTKYFRDNFASISFEKRAGDILKKGKDGSVNIDLVMEKDSDSIIGYCASSISSDREGEVESLFLLSEYRGMGIGDALMERALKWLEDNGAVKMKIGVAYGNDEVLTFYQRHGFYPRTYVLYRK